MSQEIINVINKTRWVVGSSRNLPLMTSDLIVKSYRSETSFMKGFRLGNMFYIYHNQFHQSFRDDEDIALFWDVLNKRFRSGIRGFLSSYKEETRDEISMLMKLNSYKEKIKDFSKKELIGFLKICSKDFVEGVKVIQYPVFVSLLKEKGKIRINEDEFTELNKVRDEHARSGWFFVNHIQPLLLRKISGMLGITEKQAGCMTMDEAIDSLEKGKLSLNAEELDKRDELTVIISTATAMHMMTGDPAKEYRDMFTKRMKISSGTLKGNPCYPGRVRGMIRKVNDQRELDKIKEGDILATYMTTVHFVPYIHKIKAVLTEEGGHSCHAVIIAREFRKPCITGIRGLMGSLKDGDMVEVDAGKGVVTKIDKKG